MGRRKLSTEERINKQKAKLQGAEPKFVSNYVPKVSIKEIALEEANKHGYHCIIEKNVIMFLYEKYDEKKCDEIRGWLMEKYGTEDAAAGDKKDSKDSKHTKQLPFSVGFKKNTKSLVEQASTTYADDFDQEENTDD